MHSEIVVKKPGRTIVLYDSSYFLPHILNYDYECSESPAVIARIADWDEVKHLYTIDVPQKHREDELSKILQDKDEVLAWLGKENYENKFTWYTKGDGMVEDGKVVYWYYPDAFDVEIAKREGE